MKTLGILILLLTLTACDDHLKVTYSNSSGGTASSAVLAEFRTELAKKMDISYGLSDFRIAANESGEIAIIFQVVDDPNYNSKIFLSYYSNKRWLINAEEVTSASGYIYYNDVVLDDAGRPLVMWKENGELYSRTLVLNRSNELSLDSKYQVTNSSNDFLEPVCRSGKCITFWINYDDSYNLYSSYYQGQGNWSAPNVHTWAGTSDPIHFSHLPLVSINKKGNAFISLGVYDSVTSKTSIYVAELFEESWSEFEESAALFQVDSISEHTLTLGDSDSAAIVWQDGNAFKTRTKSLGGAWGAEETIFTHNDPIWDLKISLDSFNSPVVLLVEDGGNAQLFIKDSGSWSSGRSIQGNGANEYVTYPRSSRFSLSYVDSDLNLQYQECTKISCSPAQKVWDAGEIESYQIEYLGQQPIYNLELIEIIPGVGEKVKRVLKHGTEKIEFFSRMMEEAT